MVVSSGNKTGLRRSSLIFGRSFVLSKKNKGPSTELLGASCFVLPHSEKSSLIRKIIIFNKVKCQLDATR